ncbi:MAG TPA: hypothetical protein GX514_03325 [Thermoanaerobacterales bacterium]|uniref:hypothetical protein n=1 Tax=Tepidanaerobacter sp. GT38 TaxID=2722793 RepID=UPI001855BAD0|nr:hypothetical protein [Tepidanaerobacter sp. GT38]MCG1012782.1 hypothetical protein [Tepidanaerobacter sp. GT38]HHY41864.1 hypothetical protein [Thermoanaerobacterales bacterium]
MADIRDFFSRMGNESTASVAYLLLMANILGLVVCLESRKTENVIQKESLTSNDKATTQAVKPQDLSKAETFLKVMDKNKHKLEDTNVAEEAKTVNKSIETPRVDTIESKNKTEPTKSTDKIIDFKEAVATRIQEAKEPLKPLVWKFPKSLF